MMKLGLRQKLTISYLLLSIILVGLLFACANYFLKEEFQAYVISSQEKKNALVLGQVEETYDKTTGEFSLEKLLKVGDSALSDGLIVMVNNSNGTTAFCMSDVQQVMCDRMLSTMEEHMKSVFPGFKGEYQQKSYPVKSTNQIVGELILGYYGPYYYDDSQIQFLNRLNQILGISSLFCLLIAGVFGYFMAQKLSSPIRLVTNHTRELEQGNYTQFIQQKSSTKELDQLIYSVNALALTLERQQSAQKRMAKDYAHEIRTPLSTLQSTIEAIMDGIWEPTNERLEGLRQEVLRLTRMVASIEKIVELEESVVVIDKTEVDFTRLCEVAASNMETSATEKGLQLRLKLHPCKVKADQDKLMQVLINLLSNGIKYTNEGSITITLEQKQNMALLCIKDTGIGMSKEDAAQCFSYLYRADLSRNRTTGGSGIGLALAKAIVDAHGGRIEVESKLNKGTTFTVLL